MIDRRDSFDLKAGTLYPILHTLETDGAITSYEVPDGGRIRRYCHITQHGTALLGARAEEWRVFSGAVDRMLSGGSSLASV